MKKKKKKVSKKEADCLTFCSPNSWLLHRNYHQCLNTVFNISFVQYYLETKGNVWKVRECECVTTSCDFSFDFEDV